MNDDILNEWKEGTMNEWTFVSAFEVKARTLEFNYLGNLTL